MAATNRHNHYIEKIEAQLDTIDGLNILSEFELPKWKNYEFPYVYVMINNTNKNDYHEDFYKSFAEEVTFDLWVGVESNTGGDIRSIANDTIFDIEKIFIDFYIDNLETADFTLKKMNRVTINDYAIVDNTERTKQIYVLRGSFNVEFNWK